MNTKYIGLDAHSSTCTFCVVDPQGTEIDSRTIATNGRLLVDYLQSLGKNLTIAFEECDLSYWLFETLSKHVKKIVICNPAANAQYKRAKTDKLDARNLANLLRGGFLKPVFHDATPREQLRMLISSYEDHVQEIVRLKNRLKTIKRREKLHSKRNQLTHSAFIREHLEEQLNQLLITQETYKERVTKHVRKFKECHILIKLKYKIHF